MALVSLRFKPGFVSHLSAFAKACHELGFESEFVVDLRYKRFPDLAAVAPVSVYTGTWQRGCFTHALFTNVSLQNRRLALQLKAWGVRILYLYHEPWKRSLDFLKGEGFKGWISATLAHHASKAMLKISDAVILGSRYGAEVYGERDVRYNRNAFHLPLMFDDEVLPTEREELGRRQYFSYIGAICRSHGFDQYLAFVRESLRRKPNLRFLIASRLPLPPYVLKDPIIRRNLNRVEILCGRPLQTEEINECYRESFCVWNLYWRSTQSGVLPKAFMFGTPVLASRLGSFCEYVKDRCNGRFGNPEDTQGIEAALDDIRENIARYTVNCRKTFLETFFYRANLQELARVLA